MLISNKHFTPVIGLDIHIVILFGFPVPLPHPYIGFVIDPMDYIPFIGATTKINHVPRGKSDTSGIVIILFHIPMGGPFLLAPMIGHDSVNFFGSQKVKVEGNMMSPSGHMLMTCNDIGLPLSAKPGKKLKPIPSMYLPTSFSIPLSFGKPVMVGGPYVPDWAGALLNLVMSFGFGALLKGLGKVAKKAKKVISKFNHARQKKIGGSDKLSSTLCKLGFEPVDLVQGIVINTAIDFELSGPIPIIWERNWNSDSEHEGPLGHGTHFCYDLRLLEIQEEDTIALLMGDGRSTTFEYLATPGESDYNRPEKMTLTRTDLDTYTVFDHTERLYYDFKKIDHTESRLQAIRNEAGFMISFHYNGTGRLLQIIDSVGRHLKMAHDTEGRILSVTAVHRGEQKHLIGYSYNEAGDLNGVTDALGQTTHIRYENHLMVEKTDRNGQTFYWEYDRQKRCIHTFGDGGLLEGWIEYHPDLGYNEVTNGQGHTTTYYYTPAFLVTQVKDPLGNSTFTDYTADFEVYRQIDEEGNVTGYTYDQMGNRTSMIQPDGSTYSYAYDETGRMILMANPEGGSRTIIYNDELLHTVTEADGSITVFRFNERNLLSKIEDNQDNPTLFRYDEDANLVSMTLPNGGTSDWAYDVWGNCIRYSSPLKDEQRFKYDALGRVTEIYMPDGNHIHLQYDAYHDILHAKDKHHDVRYEYSPTGSLRMREEDGAKVHFLYNKNEQLTTVVNEHGEMYTFKRDSRGDIIQDIGFDGMVRDYQRDATGKVIKAYRPGNRWTTFEYNANGALTRAEYNDGSWEMYAYDRSGYLVEATNEHSHLQLVRDVMGRITGETQNGITVRSTYRKDGKRSQLTSDLGAELFLTRDVNGAVSDMEAGPWAMHIERNLLGLEIERTLPGGVKSSWTYDNSGLPVSHTVQARGRDTRKRHYQWNANQRLKKITNSLTGGDTSFGHDGFGNLAWAKFEDGQYDYRLPDKVGNLYRTNTHNDRKYSAGGKLIETADARFIYDEEGYLVKKVAGVSVWEYEWYGNGLLKQVLRPDGRAVTFRYDALCRRIEKQYKGNLTRFVWDGNVPLHEWVYPASERPQVVVDDIGNMTPDHPEPVPAETLTTWIFEDRTAVPVAKIVNGRSYSIISDHIGTPCEVYDDTGEKVWACELDIYGKVRSFTGDKNFIPFRNQGQYEDAETGLYYNRCRYYSPEEGVYISQDPIRLVSGELNIYSYVDDPNISTDIYGLWTFYQLKDANGDVVYHGITDRPVQERLMEHKRDGKVFDQVTYKDNLTNRVDARNLEGSALHLDKGNAAVQNKVRKDGGFYHSYDPDNLAPGRTFLSQADIDAEMATGKTVQVDKKGRILPPVCKA